MALKRTMSVPYHLTRTSYTFSPRFCYTPSFKEMQRAPNAEVAELADALDSGSSARKGVRVQIPASAPPTTHCRNDDHGKNDLPASVGAEPSRAGRQLMDS